MWQIFFYLQDIFNVVLFGKEDVVLEPKGMLAANKESVAGAISLLENFNFDGESHFMSALERSLNIISNYTEGKYKM